MADAVDQDELTAQFTAIAGATSRQARQYLTANNWNLEAAMTEYFQSQEERAEHPDDEDENDQDYDPESETDGLLAAPSNTLRGGRRLGDGPTESQPVSAAQASSASDSKQKTAQQKKFATLGDFSASHGGGDDDEEDEKQDLFAGGEKSGLAVQNPDDLKKRIVEKAMKRQKRPADVPKPASSHFTGTARTLGGDDAPSREIAAEPSQTASRPERVDRTLHFWNDGFSIDDGDLYSTDDPRNAEILNGIRQGRAPLHIMGVMPGQEVDVEIKQHQENYVKPKKKFMPFSGQGNRLGSPTPGVSTLPGAFVPESPAPSTAPVASAPTPEVNDSKPAISLRISLADGTRLTSRFNTEHTIGDVYAFVERADPTGRAFVLQTTFPTKVLEDKHSVLGEMTEFKRGGVVVQKYT